MPHLQRLLLLQMLCLRRCRLLLLLRRCRCRRCLMLLLLLLLLHLDLLGLVLLQQRVSENGPDLRGRVPRQVDAPVRRLLHKLDKVVRRRLGHASGEGLEVLKDRRCRRSSRFGALPLRLKSLKHLLLLPLLLLLHMLLP